MSDIGKIDLSGFEVVSRESFATRAGMIVDTGVNSITFLNGTLEAINDPPYIQMLLKPSAHNFCIVGTDDRKELGALKVRDLEDNGDLVYTRAALAIRFAELMNWQKGCRYYVKGIPAASHRTLCVLFRLDSAKIMEWE